MRIGPAPDKPTDIRRVMKTISRSLLQQPAWLPLVTFLVLVCWLYLPDVLFHGPAGLHFIRQTDSISFAQRYGHPSWNLFTPAVHDLRNCPAARVK